MSIKSNSYVPGLGKELAEDNKSMLDIEQRCLEANMNPGPSNTNEDDNLLDMLGFQVPKVHVEIEQNCLEDNNNLISSNLS